VLPPVDEVGLPCAALGLEIIASAGSHRGREVLAPPLDREVGPRVPPPASKARFLSADRVREVGAHAQRGRTGRPLTRETAATSARRPPWGEREEQRSVWGSARRATSDKGGGAVRNNASARFAVCLRVLRDFFFCPLGLVTSQKWTANDLMLAA
jgi:hypothetical protein